MAVIRGGCVLDALQSFLCCNCGFQRIHGCGEDRACCHEAWRPSALTAEAVEGFPPEAVPMASRRNLTLIDARIAEEALCDGTWDSAAKCRSRGTALLDPECRRLLAFTATLSRSCMAHLIQDPQCVRGAVTAAWVTEFHATDLWGSPVVGRRLRARAATSVYSTGACISGFQRLENIFIRAEIPHVLSLSDPHRLGIWFRQTWNNMLWRCADVRKAELEVLVSRAASIWQEPPAMATHPPAQTHAETAGSRPVIGIVIALNWKKHADFYGQALEMWECYCKWHKDCRVVLDTEELPEEEYPLQTKTDFYTGRSQVVPGKEWNRWLALARHLEKFELALTVDPDQFPSRECFLHTSLGSALRLAGLAGLCEVPSKPDGLYAWSDGRGNLPDVVMRDHPRYQRITSTSILFRRTRGGQFFLQLLLEKMKWPGLPVLDQTAYEHTVLEFLELWMTASSESGMDPGRHRLKHKMQRSAECFVLMFAAGPGRSWALHDYAECWHAFLESVVGPFGDVPGERGQRASVARAPFSFIDPRLADISFTLGARVFDVPLIWHIEGRDKHYSNNGTSVFDARLQELWGHEDLPPKRRPGRWAGQAVTSSPSVGSSSHPRCAIWWQAARRSEEHCEPGTGSEDCRKGTNLLVC